MQVKRVKTAVVGCGIISQVYLRNMTRLFSILDVVAGSRLALSDPAPFARVSGGTNEAMTFTVRVWCKTEDYWDLFFDLNQGIVEAFAAKGVQAPALRVVNEQQ